MSKEELFATVRREGDTGTQLLMIGTKEECEQYARELNDAYPSKQYGVIEWKSKGF